MNKHTPNPDVVYELARHLDPLIDERDRLDIRTTKLPDPLTNADLDALADYWNAHCGWLEDRNPKLARDFERQLQRAMDEATNVVDEAVRILQDDTLDY